MERRLLDSNIIIYAVQPQYQNLNEYLQDFEIGYSKITQVEVLGYHLLPKADKTLFEIFFSNILAYDVSEPVIEKAIGLKQIKKMTLGDSLIAATSIFHDVPLFTRNVDDFKHIPNITVINPFDLI